MAELYVSKWEGLWYDANGAPGKKFYRSRAIKNADLRQLPAGVRLQVRHNPWKEKALDKRPSLQFRLVSCANVGGSGSADISNAVEELVPIEYAVKCAIALLRDHEYGCSIDDLVVEAAAFMRKGAVRAVAVENL